jgi:hypothetical protein
MLRILSFIKSKMADGEQLVRIDGSSEDAPVCLISMLEMLTSNEMNPL